MFGMKMKRTYKQERIYYTNIYESNSSQTNSMGVAKIPIIPPLGLFVTAPQHPWEVFVSSNVICTELAKKLYCTRCKKYVSKSTFIPDMRAQDLL